MRTSQPLWLDAYKRRPLEGVKDLIACRYPQAVASGSPMEQDRYLGVAIMTAGWRIRSSSRTDG